MSNEFTSYIDTAQVVLYVFWVFFFGLVYWLRKEDRREGYPLESDNPRYVRPATNLLIPKPKSFLKPWGGEYLAPNFERDTRDISARRTAGSAGSTLEPVGDPLLANVGPGAYAARMDAPDLTREGEDLMVPMRAAPAYTVLAGSDPRGWPVVGADGKVGGTVSDIWVDRADIMARYLEVQLPGAVADDAGATGPTRLLPVPMAYLRSSTKTVEVDAIRAEQFTLVPTLKEPHRVTLAEEERIMAFYAGGFLYADPKRLGPVV